MSLDNILDISIKAAQLAGREIMEVYKDKWLVLTKVDSSPLTEADIKSHNVIKKILNENFPAIPVISEEDFEYKDYSESNMVFMIDPLDGTKEFISKNGEFTVNIALIRDGKSIMGVIYHPTEDIMYYSLVNNGAYKLMNGRKYKLKVSRVIEEITFLKSRSHSTSSLLELIARNKKKIKLVRSVGSSIKGCLIADSKGEVYYRMGNIWEWDIAAVSSIVSEAGGIMRSMDNSEIIFNKINPLHEKGFYIINRIENKMY